MTRWPIRALLGASAAALLIASVPFGSGAVHEFGVLKRIAEERAALLKAAGLTGAQYNVLRILRGAEPEGLPCRGIGERMISHDPDMTRLLDRMEKRGLLSRARQTDDRRVIKTRISPAGLAILKNLDQPVRELHKRQFHHLPSARLKTLAELLEEVRARGLQ